MAQRRVYPLNGLTQEQLAVTFAMCSRNPESFDRIAEQVTEARAASFNEKWVVGYGHGSVAEHAVIQLAIENISRIAADALEDNRLGSYTEKSSRYQVMQQGSYHVPEELSGHPGALDVFDNTCLELFAGYESMVNQSIHYLSRRLEQRDQESSSAYRLRLRRIATDHCRLLLPAATLTNLGVTMNAREMERAITKLLSSDLLEEKALGADLLRESARIAPTLVKYAGESPFLKSLRAAQAEVTEQVEEGIWTGNQSIGDAYLVSYDPLAETRIAAALVYRNSRHDYLTVLEYVNSLNQEARRGIISRCLSEIGPHDPAPREFEMAHFAFEFNLDYGAYREFKRHRMLTCLPQPLTVNNWHTTPQLVIDAGLTGEYQSYLETAEAGYSKVYEYSPLAAQYLVTHAHYRQVLAKINLRELYHLFKLRTAEQAHFSIRGPVSRAMQLAVERCPGLFTHLQLQDYPEWWPFSSSRERSEK